MFCGQISVSGTRTKLARLLPDYITCRNIRHCRPKDVYFSETVDIYVVADDDVALV